VVERRNWEVTCNNNRTPASKAANRHSTSRCTQHSRRAHAWINVTLMSRRRMQK
jgi:hypothetical protein